MLDKSKIEKILILRYRFVGDTVLSIPFIQNVKENFPSATLDVLVSPNSGELIEGNPNVNKIIYFDNSKFHKYETRDLNLMNGVSNEYYSSFPDCIKGLREKKYDLAFILKRSFSSAILAALSRIKYRVGFDTEFRSFLLTHSVKYNKKNHELDNFLNCLRVLDIEPKKYNPEIYPTEIEKLKAKEYLVKLDRFKLKVLIHATSAHPAKMWPRRYCARLVDFLYKEFDAQFVFTGARIDKAFYEEVLNLCKYKEKIKTLNLCGMTTIRECFSIYKGMDIAICVDSGNAHIAASAEIPTYVLYGPTRPECWLPTGKMVFPMRLNQLLPCQPCDVKIDCTHLSCMKLLTPEFIFSNLNKSNVKNSETKVIR